VRNREPVFLLVAALLHASLLAVVWVTAPSSRATGTPGNEDVSSGEPKDALVDLELGDAPDEVPRPKEEAPQRVARSTPVPALRPGRVAPRAVESERPREGGTEPEGAPASSPAAQDTVEPNPPLVGALPGLDGKPIWAVPGVLPEAPLAGRVAAPSPPVVPAAPPPALGPIARPVQAALDYLGSGVPKKAPPAEPTLYFPAAGTFASALADSVRSSSTSAESETTFELIVNAQGALASVSVVAAAPENRKECERVAGALAARFTGQTFQLPDAFTAGSRIRVTVQSAMTKPDGTKHGVTLPMPKIPGLPSEGDIKEDSIDDRHRGTIKGSLPPVQFSVGLSFNFDVTSIRAKRRRVIHTRIHATPLARLTSQGAADPRR
jgi:hypothetical protein